MLHSSSPLLPASPIEPCLLQDRLEHLRKQCGPHVSAAAKDSVEGICSKIYHISLEYVKRIREKHLAILKENNISGREPAMMPSTLYPSPD